MVVTGGEVKSSKVGRDRESMRVSRPKPFEDGVVSGVRRTASEGNREY